MTCDKFQTPGHDILFEEFVDREATLKKLTAPTKSERTKEEEEKMKFNL